MKFKIETKLQSHITRIVDSSFCKRDVDQKKREEKEECWSMWVTCSCATAETKQSNILQINQPKKATFFITTITVCCSGCRECRGSQEAAVHYKKKVLSKRGVCYASISLYGSQLRPYWESGAKASGNSCVLIWYSLLSRSEFNTQEYILRE